MEATPPPVRSVGMVVAMLLTIVEKEVKPISIDPPMLCNTNAETEIEILKVLVGMVVQIRMQLSVLCRWAI